jgi:7,8-dihydro-6-hydroxymethylpterin-pyrophosphokinase
MTGRSFVLGPLSRIRPDLVLPGQWESVSVLLEKLGLNAIRSIRLVLENW